MDLVSSKNPQIRSIVISFLNFYGPERQPKVFLNVATVPCGHPRLTSVVVRPSDVTANSRRDDLRYRRVVAS